MQKPLLSALAFVLFGSGVFAQESIKPVTPTTDVLEVVVQDDKKNLSDFFKKLPLRHYLPPVSTDCGKSFFVVHEHYFQGGFYKLIGINFAPVKFPMESIDSARVEVYRTDSDNLTYFKYLEFLDANLDMKPDAVRRFDTGFRKVEEATGTEVQLYASIMDTFYRYLKPK